MKTTRSGCKLGYGLLTSALLACGCVTVRGAGAPVPSVVDSLGDPPVSMGQEPVEEAALPGEQEEVTPLPAAPATARTDDALVPPGSSPYVADRIRALEALLRPLKAIPVPGATKVESLDAGD